MLKWKPALRPHQQRENDTFEQLSDLKAAGTQPEANPGEAQSSNFLKVVFVPREGFVGGGKALLLAGRLGYSRWGNAHLEFIDDPCPVISLFQLFFGSDREDREGLTLFIGQLTESSSEGAGCPIWGPLLLLPHRVLVLAALHPSWCFPWSPSPPRCKGNSCKSHCPGVCTMGSILCQSQRGKGTRCLSLFYLIRFFSLCFKCLSAKISKRDREAFYLSQGLQTCTGRSWEVAGSGALSTELQEVLSEVMVHRQNGLLKSTDKSSPTTYMCPCIVP